MAGSVKALIMVPPSGDSRAERWVAGGWIAAAHDLTQLLKSTDSVDEIHILTGEPAAYEKLEDLSPTSISTSTIDFSFAPAMLQFVQEHMPEVLVYFGAGSAPLLTRSTVENFIQSVLEASNPTARVNNIHSTDWAIFNMPSQISQVTHRLPTDNQLGWVLKYEMPFYVEGLPFSAESRMDIDTPTDLLLLSHHPGLGSATRAYLEENPVDARGRLSEIRNLLTDSAKTLTLIGRSSSDAWKSLEERTQIWVRAFVEERGMVASGRFERGEVRSLIAQVVDVWGIEATVEFLSSVSDAILWDTRVWMGHNKSWPSASDRFASDLGWVDEIEDSRLREFTGQIVDAKIPITTGGHSTVSGGVMVLLDSIQPQ